MVTSWRSRINRRACPDVPRGGEPLPRRRYPNYFPKSPQFVLVLFTNYAPDEKDLGFRFFVWRVFVGVGAGVWGAVGNRATNIISGF